MSSLNCTGSTWTSLISLHDVPVYCDESTIVTLSLPSRPTAAAMREIMVRDMHRCLQSHAMTDEAGKNCGTRDKVRSWFSTVCWNVTIAPFGPFRGSRVCLADSLRHGAARRVSRCRIYLVACSKACDLRPPRPPPSSPLSHQLCVINKVSTNGHMPIRTRLFGMHSWGGCTCMQHRIVHDIPVYPPAISAPCIQMASTCTCLDSSQLHPAFRDHIVIPHDSAYIKTTIRRFSLRISILDVSVSSAPCLAHHRRLDISIRVSAPQLDLRRLQRLHHTRDPQSDYYPCAGSVSDVCIKSTAVR